MSQDFHGEVGQVAGEKVVNKGGKTRLELHIQETTTAIFQWERKEQGKMGTSDRFI